MASEIDPLTLLTNELAKFIETSPVVKQAMGLAKKNIEAFNKIRDTILPDVVSESDVPEVRIEMSGGPSNINLASNVAQMMVNFTLSLNSGDQRITSVMYPVFWAIFATMASGIVGSSILGLKWRDKTFVQKYEFLNTTAGQSDPQLNRGIKGWTAISQLTFHLYFSKSDISNFVNGV